MGDFAAGAEDDDVELALLPILGQDFGLGDTLDVICDKLDAVLFDGIVEAIVTTARRTMGACFGRIFAIKSGLSPSL